MKFGFSKEPIPMDYYFPPVFETLNENLSLKTLKLKVYFYVFAILFFPNAGKIRTKLMVLNVKVLNDQNFINLP